jgi:multidrug resistance efflux pump
MELFKRCSRPCPWRSRPAAGCWPCTCKPAILEELRAGASEKDIAVAEASLQSAKASLQSAEASLAGAQAGLVSAQSGLTKAELSRDALSDADVTAAANLASARAALSSAQAQLAALLKGADAETVEQARLNWEQAKNSLWNAQLERDAVKGRPGVPNYMKTQMDIAVANAEIAVQLAEIGYRQAQEDATDEAIAAARATVISAEAQVTTAQASLDDIDDQSAQAEAAVTQAEASVAQAEAGVLQAEAGVLQAEAGVAQAEANLASLRAGAPAKDLATAEINVAQARLALESAQRGLENVELIAPASGTVTAVQAAPGALVGSGSPIVILLDMTQLEFHTTNLSERDLAQIFPGQTAVVTLKAYPDEPLEAAVVRIGLQAGAAVGDASTFPVMLVLSETDLEIRPGMTGRAEIRCEE